MHVQNIHCKTAKNCYEKHLDTNKNTKRTLNFFENRWLRAYVISISRSQIEKPRGKFSDLRELREPINSNVL